MAANNLFGEWTNRGHIPSRHPAVGREHHQRSDVVASLQLCGTLGISATQEHSELVAARIGLALR
jgi:hypothetical protein